jgi:hypothetical protein
MPHAQQTIPLPFRCQPLFCRAKFRCRRTRPDRNKRLIYIHFLVMRGRFSRVEKSFFPAVREKTDARQSGRSKNLHQPFGLISPATTWHDRGGRNKLQAAQARPLLGRS